MPLVTFSAGQVINSATVNANFGLCVLTDTSRTVTVQHTYTASQTFTGGWSAAAACSISAGGLTTNALTLSTAVSKIVPGATSLSFRNNADSADNLLITDAGGVTCRAGITATTGTFSGAITAGTTIARNTSDGSDNSSLALTGGGAAASTRGGLISLYGNENASTGKIELVAGSVAGGTLDFYTSGALRLSINDAGSLVMGVAASKLVPGATSFSHRNNADNADNLLITDAGISTFRNDIKVSVNTKNLYFRNAAASTDLQGIGADVNDYINVGTDGNAAGVIIGTTSGSKKVGFFASQGTAKATVTGSRGANAALASLLTALAGYGLLTDSSS